MRLERLASAVAIVLLGSAAIGPGAYAAASPTATILAPTAGEIVSATSIVRISYAGYAAGAQNISGYLMLDGQPAGTFMARVSSANGTAFDARLSALSFASGSYTLTARVFTERDNPVDTPPMAIGIDLPPVVRDLSYAYDLDARELRIGVNVTDDHGDSLVRFATGANNTTHLVNGSFVATLHAPRNAGLYNATVNATDGWNHTVQVRFDYTVADREAQLVVTEATYLLGGRVRVSGTVHDPDRAVDVTVVTPLGPSATANLSATNGSWSLLLPVTPSLGTFNGTARSTDAWRGNTSVAFSFTIGGARETFFQRNVTTALGAHADVIRTVVPAALEGRIEICVDTCGPGASGPTLRAVAENAVCSDANNAQCRVLTGRPLVAGSFEMCENRRPQNQLAYDVAHVIHEIAGVGPCTSAMALADPALDAAPGGNTTVPPLAPGNATAIVVRMEATNATLACESLGPDRTCAYETTASANPVEISWTQGPQKMVEVRITGVRI